MLIATDYARKMTLDMRMIDPDKYEDHPDNKASYCARKIAEYYRNLTNTKGHNLSFRILVRIIRGNGTSTAKSSANSWITQLKKGALGARVIDEGATAEKSGMNFSEYISAGIILKCNYILENNGYISRLVFSSDYQLNGIQEIRFKKQSVL